MRVVFIARQKTLNDPGLGKRCRLAAKKHEVHLITGRISSSKMIKLHYCNLPLPLFWLYAIKKIAELKPDVVLSFSIDNIFPALFAKLLKIRCVYEAIELPLEQGKPSLITSFKKIFYRPIVVAALKTFDKTIATDEYRAKFIKIRFNLNTEPSVIYNVPEGARRQRVPKELLNAAKKSILISGTLQEYRKKQLLALMRAAKRLKIPVLFVGIQEYSQIEKELKLLGFKPKFVQYLPPEQLFTLMNVAKGIFLTYSDISFNDYFASPYKLFDCMHTACPIISPDRPFLTKIIEKYKLGAIYQDDYESVERALVSVLKNWRQFKKNLSAASKLFNWEIEGRKYLKECGLE